MQVGRNRGKIDGAPLHHHLAEKPRISIWPLLRLMGGAPRYCWVGMAVTAPHRCPLTPLAGIGRNHLLLLPTWPHWHHRAEDILVMLCGSKSLDCSLGLYTTAVVRGKSTSFLPEGANSLFHYSAFSDTTLVGKRKHLTIAGQGMKSRLLADFLPEGVGTGHCGRSPLRCLDAVEWLLLKCFCLTGCPFVGPLTWKHKL